MLGGPRSKRAGNSCFSRSHQSSETHATRKQPESLAIGKLAGNHIVTGSSPGPRDETETEFSINSSTESRIMRSAIEKRAESNINFPPCANESCSGAPK